MVYFELFAKIATTQQHRLRPRPIPTQTKFGQEQNIYNSTVINV